jgi:hypothetical protein
MKELWPALPAFISSHWRKGIDRPAVRHYTTDLVHRYTVHLQYTGTLIKNDRNSKNSDLRKQHFSPTFESVFSSKNQHTKFHYATF